MPDHDSHERNKALNRLNMRMANDEKAEERHAARARLEERMEHRSDNQHKGARRPAKHTAGRSRSEDPQHTLDSSERRSQNSAPTHSQRREPADVHFNFANAYGELANRFGSRIVLIGAVVIVFAIILIITVSIRSCSSSQSEEPATTTQSDAIEQEAVEESTPSIDREKLVSLIGEDAADRLIAGAEDNEDLLWIASHPDSYAAEGTEVQVKLLTLAAEEPAAISYVRNYPEKYPAESQDSDATAIDDSTATPDANSTRFPHLYQWDERWGYTEYSSTGFGMTGCCPTSMAMVYQGLTGKTDMTPYDMAELARNGGFMSEYNGTDSAFFFYAATELGLYCEEIYPSAENIISVLSSGEVIIANVGPGQFTDEGHFFVLAGLDEDGKVILNDPYSAERSNVTWDAETIASESIAMFAFDAP